MDTNDTTDSMSELQFTDEQLDTIPGIQETLVAEIQDRAAASLKYSQERDQAKTQAKQSYFHNKLIRNNEVAATLIVALERVINKRTQSEADSETHGTTDQKDP